MNEDIKELRQIAADAKTESFLTVKPVLERLVDRLIDTVEELSLRVESEGGGRG